MPLIRNAIITPDGTVLVSRHRWDFVSHLDKVTNELYFTDGGLDYMRRSVNKVSAKDDSASFEEGHEVVREAMEWGTLGKNGDQALKYIRLKDMETDHIKAVLKNELRIPEVYKKAFKEELKYRKRHDN